MTTEAETRETVESASHTEPSLLTNRARHVANIALIVLSIVAMFWRVFFAGETLIDVATLNNQLPWGYGAADSSYPYDRRDLTDTYVTREYFVVASYRDGEFPLWNPYTMAGHPIYADGVTRTLSPSLLFYAAFDVPLGYSLARLTELMVAGVLMYVFLLGIGASANGALVGSLVFGLSAHSMLHLSGLGWWGGLMWLPLIMLFADRAIKRDSVKQAGLAGAFLAAQFYCGYLPNQIYYVALVAFYYAFFAWSRDKLRVGRAAMMAAMTIGVGLALSATQWVPMLELLGHSNRKIVGDTLGYIYLPPWYLATLVFPNLFGSAYDVRTLTLFTALGVSHDHILYLGVAALAPLGFSLFVLNRRDWREKEVHRRAVFFLLLAAVSLFIMMAAPLYVPITRHIPVLQVIRVAVRAGVLFLFAASVLVAFGTDHLLSARGETLTRFAACARKLVIAAFLFVAVAGVASIILRAAGFALDLAERGSLAFVRRAAYVLSAQFLSLDAGILIPLFMAFATVRLLSWRCRGQLTSTGLLAALIALLLIDLFWIGSQLNPTFEPSRVFPTTQITSFLQSLPSGRVLAVPSGLETNRRVVSRSDDEKIIAPPNTLLAYQIPTVTGKNQQFPKWYREYASLIEPQPNMSHVVFDKARSQFLDLINVRYVMTHALAPAPEGAHLLTSSEGVAVYENRNVLPRAFFAARVLTASHNDAIELMRSSFDGRTAVVLEAPDRAVAEHPDASSATASITEDKRNRVSIETDNPSDGVLVLSDNYYPGWRALVDGVPTEVYRANCAMRAVQLPAGRHLVSFEFAPASLRISSYFSLAACAILFVFLAAPSVTRTRDGSKE